jgi:hypothetical protein
LKSAGAWQGGEDVEGRRGRPASRCDPQGAAAGLCGGIDPKIDEQICAARVGARLADRKAGPCGFDARAGQVGAVDQQAHGIDAAADPPARWIDLGQCWWLRLNDRCAGQRVRAGVQRDPRQPP